MPLESRVDYLTLHTGKKFQVPFDVLIVFATNLDPSSLADEACIARIVEEVAIVAPKIIVVMGEDALAALADVGIPLAAPIEPKLGVIQSLTPMIDALYVPDIDGALDEQEAKREFWDAFRVLGEWYAALPPY